MQIFYEYLIIYLSITISLFLLIFCEGGSIYVEEEYWKNVVYIFFTTGVCYFAICFKYIILLTGICINNYVITVTFAVRKDKNVFLNRISKEKSFRSFWFWLKTLNVYNKWKADRVSNADEINFSFSSYHVDLQPDFKSDSMLYIKFVWLLLKLLKYY